MSNFRFLDYNYCFDSATNFYPSSEDPSFLSSNMALFSRSKVWRGYGYFQITASNCYIDFKESSVGPQLTATLQIGVYSTAQLITQIQSKMGAAGTASAYTVAFSRTTGLWTITSSLAYLSILWSTGTNTANSPASLLGFTAGDSTGAVTYQGQKIALHSYERFVIDLGANEDIDSFAVVFDPVNGHKFSNAATFLLEASYGNAWDAPAVSQSVSIDDIYGSMTYFFSSVQTYRYWSLKITDPANPYLYVEIPKILLAKATQLNQVPEVGFQQIITDLSQHVETAYGNKYSDVYPARRQLKFAYAALTEADQQTLIEMVGRLGECTPIGIVLDPDATVFDKDRFFMYGRFSGDTTFDNPFYTYFDVTSGNGMAFEEAF